VSADAAKRRVVIVDDDALVRESVLLGLEAAGLAATAVEDAAQAIETIRAEKPDLIVLDLYFPGADGREIARALKADPATAKTPILFFSGSNEAIDVVSGLDAGGADYVTKPIDGEVLVRKIRSLLNLPPEEGR
jgi:DNA-binding response OmpR family regulator